MAKLRGCFPAIIFTLRVDFVRQYYFVLKRVYNKIVSQLTSVSMLEAKTSGKRHQIMVSKISHCVMFLYWGKRNLVVLLQREFLFRPLRAVFVGQEGVELKYCSSRPISSGVQSLLSSCGGIVGAWRLENEPEAVAENRVTQMCVRTQIEFKMSILYWFKMRAFSR